jgi:hypothetical protein
MADDTQPERGFVLLDAWHVGLWVISSTAPDEAERLRAQVEQSLLSWPADISARLSASVYVDVDS